LRSMNRLHLLEVLQLKNKRGLFNSYLRWKRVADLAHVVLTLNWPQNSLLKSYSA
jgi:hypothetical protein